MEILKELVSFISVSHQLKTFPCDPIPKTGKLRELYEGVKSSKFKSDDWASNQIYGEDASCRKYKDLKKRLYNRLIDSIFIIDFSSVVFSEYAQIVNNCRKSELAVGILISNGLRFPAMLLAEKTLKVSLKNEFSEVSLSLARRLRRYYGTTLADSKKFKEYDILVKRLSDLVGAEILAEGYFEELALHFSITIEVKKEVIEKAQNFSRDLKEKTKGFSSNKLNLMRYLVYTISYQLIGDLKNTIKVCQQAVDFFSKAETQNIVALFAFKSRMFNCYIDEGKYLKAEKEIIECLDLVSPGSSNWFSTYKWYVILAFQIQDYQKAYHLFIEATRHEKFEKLFPRKKEIWKIYNAYITYCISIGKIELDPTVKSAFGKFRLGTFLNDVPKYSKDKRGLNIPILIVQILFLLQQKKLVKVIDKVESLNMYCHRYLQRNQNFRSNCFIKMLLLLPKSNFHKEAVNRKVKTYLTKLESVPFLLSSASSETEIIPYEILWEFVLDNLDNKLYVNPKMKDK